MNGGSRPSGACWAIDEIPVGDIDRDQVRNDRQLLCLLAAASYLEITAHLYTGNLVAFYRGDDQITAWLSEEWQLEELRHGAALKRYVETVWPEFDWNAGYRGFFADYSRCCTVERLAGTRTLELAARCVVETGTATFYRALSEMAAEPVLKEMTARISSDEVRHYKHFYHFFLHRRDREGVSRRAVLGTLWQRATAVDVEDAFLAFKHVFLASTPNAEFHVADYDAFRAAVRRRGERHYPHGMAVRMMLKPLELNPSVLRVIVPPMVSAARLLLLR